MRNIHAAKRINNQKRVSKEEINHIFKVRFRTGYFLGDKIPGSIDELPDDTIKYYNSLNSKDKKVFENIFYELINLPDNNYREEY